MTRPVYQRGVRVDSGGCLGCAVTPEFLFLWGGSAARVGPAQRQRGLPVRELGIVDGRDPLNPPVTSTGQNSGCPNRDIVVWTNSESILSAALPGLGGTAECSMGGPGRLRNSRGLKPHPGRTDSPGFLPIWGRTFPYHGNVADGQLRQTGSGDETVQPLLPRQTEQFRNFTNRLGFQSGEFPNNPGWFDSGAIGQLGRVQLKQMPQIASCGEVIPGSGGFQAKPVIWAVRPGSSAAFGCAVFAPAAGGGAPPIGCAPA